MGIFQFLPEILELVHFPVSDHDFKQECLISGLEVSQQSHVCVMWAHRISNQLLDVIRKI
jgi:hypothetical protein